MKRFLTLLCGPALAAAALFAEEKPVPVMPTEVTLTTGRVLRNVQVIRWEKDRVVLKYTGGVDPIAFSLFKSPAPDELPALRAEGMKAEARAKAVQANPAIGAPEEVTTYSGQMFIPTRGAGSYKFGGRKIYVLPPEAESALKVTMSPKRLPRPLLVTSTDADGKFTFRLAKGRQFFLFAQASRLVGAMTDLYEWTVPSSTIDNPEFVELGPKGYTGLGHSDVVFDD